MLKYNDGGNDDNNSDNMYGDSDDTDNADEAEGAVTDNIKDDDNDGE